MPVLCVAHCSIIFSLRLRVWANIRFNRFIRNPQKPVILSLCVLSFLRRTQSTFPVSSSHFNLCAWINKPKIQPKLFIFLWLWIFQLSWKRCSTMPARLLLTYSHYTSRSVSPSIVTENDSKQKISIWHIICHLQFIGNVKVLHICRVGEFFVCSSVFGVFVENTLTWSLLFWLLLAQ